MKLIPQTPQKAIRSLVKQPVLRSEMDTFKANLIGLLNKINAIDQRPKDETEEHLKNDLRDFLRDTYYRNSHAINTKDKKDLVIHTDKTTDSDVAVIIEAKRPNNVAEMVSVQNCNKKALHELVLYYFDERNGAENTQLKQLIITNINEWYVFDANAFDKYIYRNTQIKKLHETKRNDRKDNPFFYEELAKIIAKADFDLDCVYFNLKDYQTALRNDDPADDHSLTTLYKLLSPQYLLKVAAPNDANSLNDRFYRELLHIIGLEETKDGGKAIIRRKATDRHAASLLESAIDAIETEDVLHRIPDGAAYGATLPERTFAVALELCITWINRILFLKLLEGQLMGYHRGDKGFLFLHAATINDFDELFKLFHKVLAVNINDRTEAIQAKYAHVPYLNSSLFDISELEDQIIKINALDNNGIMPLMKGSVLTPPPSGGGRGGLGLLSYLFQFLSAYDFASDGKPPDIQDDHRTIINASVLGKVFEKINGYKDGSIFTPAFITMYMCRQTIRAAVVQKFNEAIVLSGYQNVPTFATLADVYDQIGERFSKIRANEIVNSLKICDPAVGSGHFLVSALNEIIAVKNDLKILGSGLYSDEDRQNAIHNRHNARLRDYEVEVVNDELQITDENGMPFVYNPNNKENSRVQKILFHEKQIIIENCLFGVDINPNSVKICRLRLWIELLKNAYYSPLAVAAAAVETRHALSLPPPPIHQLQTLPNIDINIKCGNSLLSRFALDADLSKALKSIKYDVAAYRGFVNDYKNEKNRETKRGLTTIINSIKADFKTEINKNDKKVLMLNKLSGELYNLTSQTSLLPPTPKEAKARRDQQSRLEAEINKMVLAIEDVKNNAVYRNAFEWRFEFPEVLNDQGDFVGFDVVIGNPPYMLVFDEKLKAIFEQSYPEFKRNNDLYVAFFKMGFSLLKPDAHLSFITPNTFIRGDYFKPLRNFIANEKQISEVIDFGNVLVFENANVFCAITSAINKKADKEWVLKTGLNKLKGFIKPNTSDFILKNELISRLDKLTKFGDFFSIKDVGFNYWSEGRGKVRGGSIGSRVFYNGQKANSSDIPFIKGADIQKFSISFSDNYLRHNWKDYLDENDTFRFSQEIMEKVPKIIYRQTSNKIVAALDLNRNLNDKTVHIVVNGANYDFDLRAVLGILNSKMMNYFFQSFKEEEGRAFAQVKTVDIKNLPFVAFSKAQQQPIIALVDALLAAKQNSQSLNDSITQSINEWEAQIDELVYALYGITAAERAVIEGS